MPYINFEYRAKLEPSITRILTQLAGDGEVNYVITRIIDALYGKQSYKILNRGIGILESVKQEFYRRRVAPYEEKKIKESGDVYN